MKTVKVRELQTYTVDQIWAMPDETFMLEFDDKTIEAKTRPTILSWYYWRIQREYPTAPVLSNQYIGNDGYTPGKHLDMCSKVCFNTYFALNEAVDLSRLSKLIYEITNAIYNDMTYRLESYVTTVNVLDYLEINQHPTMVEMRENVQPTPESIDNAYIITRHLLYKGEEIPANNVARLCRADIPSAGQIVQSVAPRGYVTEIDSVIFRNPVMNSYMEGMNSLHDAMIESRSGAKASLAQKDPLQQTEYFNRRMQLGCSVVANLHYGDCGTKRTVKFRVTNSSLPVLAGKYFVNDKGELEAITKQHTHLIGKTINMRSTLVCEHDDPQGVCSTCMGQLALSVPPRTNLGHVCATELCSKVSQQVLSTKHLDISSAAISLDLSDYEKRFVKIAGDGNEIYLKKPKKYTNIKLVVDATSVVNIGDISRVDDVSVLSATKMSSCPYIRLDVMTEGNLEQVVVGTSADKNNASLSVEMLEYLKEYGWQLEGDSYYSIDLSHWDWNKPALMLPMKHMNMLEFMMVIKTFIESNSSDKDTKEAVIVNESLRRLVNYDSVSEALMDLHNLVSERIKVNIAHFEVIILSTMIRSAEQRDYRLPIPGQEFEFGVYNKNMENRSLGGLMPYQGQARAFVDAASYQIKNRLNHPQDTILRG